MNTETSLVRGPVGFELISIPARLLTGEVIPPQYVGVWGYMAVADTDEFSAHSIASDLDVEVDYVEAALRSFEEADLLIRTDRGWFITDLPLQLISLCLDEEYIRESVQYRFAQWFTGTQTPSPEQREQALAARKTVTSYVYVIGEPGAGMVKIGISQDVHKRLLQLQSGSPTSLAVRWSVRGDGDLERALNERFANLRAHGEWFDFGHHRNPVHEIQVAAEELASAGVVA